MILFTVLHYARLVFGAPADDPLPSLRAEKDWGPWSLEVEPSSLHRLV